jgi:hypothetical protein
VSSNERSDFPDDLDLEKGLRTTPEDVAIQRRIHREQRISPQAFKAFLESLGPRPYEELRARKGPRGEPFTL